LRHELRELEEAAIPFFGIDISHDAFLFVCGLAERFLNQIVAHQLEQKDIVIDVSSPRALQLGDRLVNET
jgi:hypothetical protein